MIKFQIRWWLMLIRTIFAFLVAITMMHATENEAPQDVEVLAQSVTKEGDVVHAVGNVVLYSPKYLITADEAYYNYQTGDLELLGNITMLEGSEYASRSGQTKLNLKTDAGIASKAFFFDETSNVWLKCDNATFDATRYLTQKSIVSSCNTQDPDWKIAFSSGELDKESKWMHLYNPVFYAGDVPIFYLPYFSFSTDTTRRTGLLRPDFGFGSEGFFYLQPIYFAPAVDWDVEVKPQIRTDRGEGIHTTYRFVDSAYSKGEMRFGYFREQEAYAVEKNLKNDEHYGYQMSYDRSALLSTHYPEIEDGLWLDINYLNDIDYYNTIDSSTRAYDKLAISRVNYYAKRDLDYVGFYSKYYIDTTKTSNKDTLQELPILHYHRFSNSFLLDNLFYSLDYKAKNYHREEGVRALQNELNIPLNLYFSFFDDYVHLSVSENIYATYASYDEEDSAGGRYGHYFKNYHQFSLFTELAKEYTSVFHTLYIGLEHTSPSYSKKEGTWDYAYGTNDLIPLEEDEKTTSLKLKQFFYDTEGEKRASHTLRQIHYHSDDKYKYGDLENEIKVYFSNNVTIANSVRYSYEYDQISRTQSALTYSDDIYTLSMRYTYQDTPASSGSVSSKSYNYLTFGLETRQLENYRFFTSINYDLEDNLFKSWSLGMKKVTKCWDYSIVYKDLTLPQLTSSGADSVNRKGIMLYFNVYPLGSIDYEVTMSEQEQKL